MENTDLQQQVENLTNQVQQMTQFIQKMQQDHASLQKVVSTHQHTDTDGTTKLRYTGVQKLADVGTPIYVGNGGFQEIDAKDANGIVLSNNFQIAAGSDTGGAIGSAVSSHNTQLTLQNLATSGFFFGSAKEYVDSPIAVTSAGNTLTDNNFTWQTTPTQELVGSYVNLYDNSGTFVATRQITANTSHTLTISGTWGTTVTAGKYFIFVPVYLGSAENPWRRVYTGEGTGEGIRFGYGVTAGGTNGLLYMDATGDLYWRNKGGTSTKLN